MKKQAQGNSFAHGGPIQVMRPGPKPGLPQTGARVLGRLDPAGSIASVPLTELHQRLYLALLLALSYFTVLCELSLE